MERPLLPLRLAAALLAAAAAAPLPSPAEGWTAPAASETPVFRLYNEFGGEHHYTMDASEKNRLVSAGWKYEGVAWFGMQ